MTHQLDLFGPKEPTLAPPDERWLHLAKRVPGHVRFGTSSWTFPGWKGLVYRREYRNDAQFMRDSLYEYARWPLAGTAGIDRSFYAPLDEVTLRTYAGQLPAGFRCVSKVWQELTTLVFPNHPAHGAKAGTLNSAFLDPERFDALIAQPYSAAFAAHAGPFVIEVPPASRLPDVGFFERRIERFLLAAPPQFHYAFELRDPALMTPRYLALLREHGASHCFNYWSKMPSLAEQLQWHGSEFGSAVVVRLMLPANADYETLKEQFKPFDRLVTPQPQMRSEVLRLIEATAARDVPTVITVNNKAEGSAPLTIAALAAMF